MSIINLGNIRFNWCGEYNDLTTYKKDDVVGYKGNSFVSKSENIGIKPSVGDNWDLMAAGSNQLENKGDIITHNGTLPFALSIGENAQTLQVVNGLPAWRNPATPPSRFVWKLQKVNGFGSTNTRVYLMADGTIKAVGSGDNYSNGDPHGGHRHLPSRVAVEDSKVKFIDVFSSGRSHYALTANGEVWSWGENNYGQLGHGDKLDLAIIKRIDFFVENNIKIKKVYPSRPNSNSARCVYFLTDDGKVYGCGANTDGNLGNGTTTDQSTPVRCGSISNIKYLAVSGRPFICYAVQENGDLWVWGWNGQGQLGLGDTTNRATPILHPSVKNVSKAACACDFTTDQKFCAGYGMVLCQDGTLWCTGYNAHGQLGLGDTVNRNSFAQIEINSIVTDIYIGGGCYGISGAITNEKKLYLWGYNEHGEMGTGDTKSQLTPQLPVAEFQGRVKTIVLAGGVSVQSCIVEADNQLWAAGYSGRFNLGINSKNDVISTFTKVLGISGNIVEWGAFGSHIIEYGLGVLYDDGSVDACGFNTTYGETGTQSATLHNVGVLTNVIF